MDRDNEGRIWLYVPGFTSFNLTSLCHLRHYGTDYLELWARRMFCDNPCRFPDSDMAVCDFVGTSGEL